jgi:SnoaL-like domain
MPVTSADLSATETLIAIESIKQLKARYFRALDIKDWDGLHGLFADGARIGPLDSGLPPSDVRIADERSTDEWLARVQVTLAGVTSVHHGHMPDIDLVSWGEARGIWAMEDLLLFPPGSVPMTLHGFGHYHETYARGADGWRIATMRLTRLRVDLT